MNISVLNPNKDPMGAAIIGYQQTGKAEKIRVLSSMFDEEMLAKLNGFNCEKAMEGDHYDYLAKMTPK